jgi:hypothetical protein
MKQTKLALILAVFFTTVALSTTPSLAERRVRPFNRIVVMLDASGSFTDRKMEAVKSTKELITRISTVKSKRSEGGDEVIVISLDAIPEVIWSGTKEQLKSENQQQWEKHFDARSDYRQCTDVEEGFMLAARQLHKEPQATNLYLFAFTDLINEPPADSAKKCKHVTLPSLPSTGFPWDAFADVETHILWTPINQKQAWIEAIKKVNLEDNFRIHSESESSTVVLKAPPKAKHVMSSLEREEGKKKITGVFIGIGKFFLYPLYGAGCLLVLMMLVGFGKKYLAGRRRKEGR